MTILVTSPRPASGHVGHAPAGLRDGLDGKGVREDRLEEGEILRSRKMLGKDKMMISYEVEGYHHF